MASFIDFTTFHFKAVKIDFSKSIVIPNFENILRNNDRGENVHL